MININDDFKGQPHEYCLFSFGACLILNFYLLIASLSHPTHLVLAYSEMSMHQDIISLVPLS